MKRVKFLIFAIHCLSLITAQLQDTIAVNCNAASQGSYYQFDYSISPGDESSLQLISSPDWLDVDFIYNTGDFSIEVLLRGIPPVIPETEGMNEVLIGWFEFNLVTGEIELWTVYVFHIWVQESYCIDPVACNYNPNAIIDDFCDYESCVGCTDPGAWNYFPYATIEGECIYLDCTGEPGGSAFIDACGICAGGNTGLEPNIDTGSESVVGPDADCMGICFGTHIVDECDVCCGEYDGTWTDCSWYENSSNFGGAYDCAGVCFGSSENVYCFVDPCMIESCDAYPFAECIPNYCDGCFADFYVNGELVDCLDSTSCVDLSGIDFGPCDMILGISWNGFDCSYISGCSTTGNNGVDYLASIFATFEECYTVCGQVACTPGDVNDDGEINILDLVREILFILGTAIPIFQEMCAGELNGDGIINVLDAVQIVSIILGS